MVWFVRLLRAVGILRKPQLTFQEQLTLMLGSMSMSASDSQTPAHPGSCSVANKSVQPYRRKTYSAYGA